MLLLVPTKRLVGSLAELLIKFLAPPDSLTAGRQSQDTIAWFDELLVCFRSCQEALTSHRSITLPRPDAQLWIATDGSVKMSGLGTILYVLRDQELHLAG